MSDKIADLHIHSYYSDGTMSPEEILTAALSKGVGLIAISDHNSLEGSLKLQKLCRGFDIQYVPAVEIDALDNGNNIHILGYGMNLFNEEFRLFAKRNRTLLDEISIKLIEKMQSDFDSITLSDYLNYSYDRKKGGWKGIHYLYKKGLTKSLKEGLKFYQTYNCSYDCVDFPSVSLAAQYIHNAGGKAILAHPGVVIKETDKDLYKKELLRFISYGLDGTECYYPSHTNQITDICLEICEVEDLLITAGSDCHGSFGNSKIGEMHITIGQLKLGNILSNQ